MEGIMKITLQRLFGQGVFFAPRQDALMSVLLAVCVFVANEIYAVLNHGPAVLHLQTPLDQALPVVPIFVIPYVSLNLFVYVTLVVFLLFQNRVFQSACLAMILAWLVSYGFYLFLQSEMIRPALTGGDVFTRMIRDVYAGDNPFNCFPSLHTSMSTILAIHWFRVNRRVAIGLACWTALIVASTILIKQHYLADLGAGLILAFGVSLLVRGWLRQRAG
jgi:membrane-associated phospholipid phosphatase